MRSITINDIDYSKHLVDGFVVNDTLTEELDSCNVILTAVKKTDFNPFDKVVIKEDDATYYFIVDTYVESKICNNPELYDYNFSLISETKVLERFILPNLKITKPKNESYIKKMGNYLSFILAHFVSPKYYLELDDNLNAELNKIQCPEWAWSAPSVKQVFNDLFSTLENPKIVKVKNGIVGAVELSKKGDAITSEFGKVADDNYQASKDYTNNILVDAKNILPTDTNTMTAPVISFRCNDKAYMTTQDVELYLPNGRIESIDKLIVSCKLQFLEASTNKLYDVIADFDITDYIVEETIYNLKTIEERSYCLYFTRGGNSIKNFNYTQKALGIIETSPAIVVIIGQEIAKYNAENYQLFGQYMLYTKDVRDLAFTCYYKNIGESRIKVARDELKKHDFSLVDNQSSQFINAVAFMQAEREKVNRLGNDIRTITMLYKDINEIPKLNDYIDDYILVNRSIAHSPNSYIFKGTFSKDFIQKNLYYGLQSRTRFVNFAMADQSVLRVENVSTNIIFTTQNRKPSQTSNQKLCTYLARNYLHRNLLGEKKLSTSIKQIVATSTFADKTTKKVFLQPSLFSLGSGVLLSCRYYDNINAGMKIDTQWVVLDTKYNQTYVPYVDENGELTSVRLELFSQYEAKYISGGNVVYDYKETNKYPEYFDDYVDDNYEEWSINNSIYKDNGEILQFDLQFNFRAEQNVVLGSNIGSLNALTDLTTTKADGTRMTLSKLRNLKIYVSTTEKYSKNADVPKGEIATDIVVDRTTFNKWTNGVLENAVKIGKYNASDTNTTLDADTSSWQSWGLATEDGQLIFGVNRDDTTDEISTSIYITIDD